MSNSSWMKHEGVTGNQWNQGQIQKSTTHPVGLEVVFLLRNWLDFTFQRPSLVGYVPNGVVVVGAWYFTSCQELLLVSKSEAFESLKLGTITGHEVKTAFKKLELLGSKWAPKWGNVEWFVKIASECAWSVLKIKTWKPQDYADFQAFFLRWNEANEQQNAPVRFCDISVGWKPVFCWILWSDLRPALKLVDMDNSLRTTVWAMICTHIFHHIWLEYYEIPRFYWGRSPHIEPSAKNMTPRSRKQQILREATFWQVPGVLTKTPSERGSFDGTVGKHGNCNIMLWLDTRCAIQYEYDIHLNLWSVWRWLVFSQDSSFSSITCSFKVIDELEKSLESKIDEHLGWSHLKILRIVEPQDLFGFDFGTWKHWANHFFFFSLSLSL